MSEEEIYKMLLTENIEKFPLLNEMFAIRNNKFKINDYTIYVTGYISLDVINRAIEKVNLIDKLQEENEHLKEQLLISNDLDNMYNLYISKDKIWDKIKERNHIIHNAKLKYGKDYEMYDDTIYAKFDIELLKELLEEE